MEQITLKRNGKPDLVFNGRELALVDEREFVGFKEDWLDMHLYKTAFGQYVLSSVFNINSCGKRCMNSALVFSAVKDLFDYLEIGKRPVSPVTLELMRQASLQDEAFTPCATFCKVRLKSPSEDACAQ